MADLDRERIRRATRALQAFALAIRLDPAELARSMTMPPEEFDAFHTRNVRNFNATMRWRDDEALDPKSMDPLVPGGFAWWAARILDIADGKQTRQ